MNVVPPDAEVVHVWYVSLRRMAACITQFARTLSDEELQRAEYFHFDRDRSRFVLARGILRMILGAYTSHPPASLSFSYGPYGKPIVEEIPFNFNLSHSGDTAVYAISQRFRVGIDVELVRPLAEMDSIAERVFTRRETSALATTGPDEKAAQFFQLWTRKESVVKGLGLGLGVSPQAIEVLHDVVHLVPGEDLSGLLRGEAESWRVHNLLVGSEYKAAVAIDGDITRILRREWGLDQPVQKPPRLDMLNEYRAVKQVAEGMEAMAERAHGVSQNIGQNRKAFLVATGPEVSEQRVHERAE